MHVTPYRHPLANKPFQHATVTCHVTATRQPFAKPAIKLLKKPLVSALTLSTFLPLLLCLALCCGTVTGTVDRAYRDRQRHIMMDLYNSTGGDQWEYNYGWSLDVDSSRNYLYDECRWSGIRCDPEGAVIVIGLGGNQLKGEIPSSIGNLGSLQELYLSNNNLIGPIPSSIGSLPNLRSLWLNNNEFTGFIPGDVVSLCNGVFCLLAPNKFMCGDGERLM